MATIKHVEEAAQQVVKSWRKRLHKAVRILSDDMQRAFLAEEVMSLVMSYAELEKMDGKTYVPASDVAAIYRRAVQTLGLDR